MAAVNRSSENLPTPRLELRWKPWEGVSAEGYNWQCRYMLVIRLGKHDCRRECETLEVSGDELSTQIGFTDVRRGSGTPVYADGTVDTPFRDGSHAAWDGWQLRLPVYATCDGKATRIETSEPAII